jgi:hypothetical protein
MKASILIGTLTVLLFGLSPGLVGAAHAFSTAETGCPTLAPTSVSGTSSTVRGMLIPRGATSLLLCRYQGLNPSATARHLERERSLRDTAQIVQVTSELNTLPMPSGVIHCPMDDGSEITATFSYEHAASLTASIGLTGCRTVSRGKLVRSAGGPGGSRLIERLTSLLDA